MTASNSAERTSIPSSRHHVLYIALTELMFSMIFIIVGVLLFLTSEMDVDAVALDLHIFAYFFLALCTILGICGAFYRSPTFVTMFCALTLAQLVFGIGSGIYCLTILFDNPDKLMMHLHWRRCLGMDSFSRSLCERTPMIQYLTLALFIQTWLIQILGLYSSQAYIQELIDEDGDAMKLYNYDEYGYW